MKVVETSIAALEIVSYLVVGILSLAVLAAFGWVCVMLWVAIQYFTSGQALDDPGDKNNHPSNGENHDT